MRDYIHLYVIGTHLPWPDQAGAYFPCIKSTGVLQSRASTETCIPVFFFHPQLVPQLVLLDVDKCSTLDIITNFWDGGREKTKAEGSCGAGSAPDLSEVVLTGWPCDGCTYLIHQNGVT